MANPHRGETPLEIGGKTFVLAFSTNALCEVEAALDRSIGQIMQTMDRVSTLRALLWAGLSDRQPGISLKAAGELMFDAGNTVVMDAITKALNLAFPAPAKDTPENP